MDMVSLGWIIIGLIVVAVIMSFIADHWGRRSHGH
jgi:uncharacterized Rmd1/YagE family protein